MRIAGVARMCAAVLVALGLSVHGLPPVDRAGVAVASTGPDLDVHRALIGETTLGGSFAVGMAMVSSSVEIAGPLLADGETRRAQLVHARGFDGAEWDWVDEDPAAALPSTPLEGPWEVDGSTCPEHPSYDCYPGAVARVSKTGFAVASSGRVDIAIDGEYYISPAMHATWGAGWHRYMEIFRPDGSTCSWATGWSSNHPSPGWYEFPVTLLCQGAVGEPPDVGFVRLRLGRPNSFDSSQSWDFLFAGLDHEVNQARLAADGACVSRAGLRREVTATSAEYVVGASPPPMPALTCMGHERLERVVVRRVPVTPAAFAEVTILAWDGHTLFGEANATLTGAQVRAAAFPAGAMADPVNTATGELFEHVVDVQLPSYGGGLAITRTYSSADVGGGLLGPGWRFGYESSLTGDLAGFGDGLVTHVTPEGAEFVYERQPDGGYLAPPATWDTLVEVSGEFELSRPDGSALRYGADGRLTAVASDDGHETLLAYDVDGHIESVTAPNGRQLAFTVASTAGGVRLTRVDTSDGRSVAYGYDGDGRLASVTDLRGQVWSYRYDSAGRLNRVTDPLGHHVHTTTYDAESRVVEQVDARGGVTTFAWGMSEGSGWVTMTDPAGGQHTDFYAGHVLLARYDPAGRRTAYHYDEYLRLTRLDQPDGTTVMFDHDGEGRLTHTHTQPPWERSDVDDPGLAATVQTAAALDGPVYGVALDADEGYAWVGRTGSLARVQLASGTVSDVAVAADHAWRAGDTLHSLVRAGSTLYVAAGWHGASGSSVRSRIIAYDLARSTSQVVADLGPATHSQIGAVAAAPDGTVVFTRQWGERAVYRLTPGVGDGFEPVHQFAEGEPGGIAADADWLYVQSTAGDGSLVKMDHDGGDVTTLATGLRWNAVLEPDDRRSWQQARALALAGGYLFTSAAGGSALARVRLDDGTVQHVAGSVFAGEVDGDYADARFQRIHDVAVTEGRLVLTDRDSERLVVVADDGVRIEVADEVADPPAALTAETVYGGDGRVLTTIDAAGRETTYGYDSAGRVTSVTGPDGVATSIAYNAQGLPVEWDTGGLVTAATYDPVTGDLVSVTEPDGATTTWSPDPAGRVVATVPPAGNVAGADPAAHATTFTYDPAGLLLTAADPLGRTVTHAYDAAGRLVASTDPAGRTTTFGHDAAGDLVEIQGPDAAAGPVVTAYDSLGRAVSVTDAGGRVTARSYDLAGNVVEVSDATGSAMLAYDLAGRVVASTDQAGRTTTFDYDAYGQPAAVRYDDGAEVTWRYDEAGRLAERSDPTGTVTYDYDAQDRPVTVAGPQGPFVYDWDALGRLVSRTTPDGGVDSWSYDHAGRVAEARLDGQLVASYGYDDAGRRSSVALGNGVVETSTYDLAGRVAALEGRDPSGVLLHRATYTYDLLDRPVRMVGAHGEEAFAYDAGDRLARVCFDVAVCDGNETDWVGYDVDAAGDRLAEQRPGVARTYGYDPAGRLAEVTVDEGSGPLTERTFAYDAVGNIVTAGGDAFAWDAAGRLASTTTDGATTAYTYDSRGLRVAADDGHATAWWLWDPLSGDLVASGVDDGGQPSLARMLPGGHGSLVDGAGWWQHRDLAGSVRTVTDASGTPAYHFAYEPFGTLREVRDGSGTPLPDPAAWPVAVAGFHTLDHEPTGLLYARARWLDPATGRFLSPDPAGGGYGYAFANPVVFTDPGGLWPHTPSSAYLHTLADIAGYVAVGTLAAALVVGAPLTAPLVGATLLATGAVMLAADVVHATGTCTSSKGNCGTALAMAGVAAAGGRYLRPLRALKTVRNSRPATLTPQASPTRPATGVAGSSSGLHSPSFVVHPNGEIVPVPRGAIGPIPVQSGKGIQFTGGSGGRGLDSRVSELRIMDPVTGGKNPLPDGYVSYSNAAGQSVNPWTAQTISKTDPWWHWAWSER